MKTVKYETDKLLVGRFAFHEFLDNNITKEDYDEIITNIDQYKLADDGSVKWLVGGNFDTKENNS